VRQVDPNRSRQQQVVRASSREQDGDVMFASDADGHCVGPIGFERALHPHPERFIARRRFVGNDQRAIPANVYESRLNSPLPRWQKKLKARLILHGIATR